MATQLILSVFCVVLTVLLVVANSTVDNSAKCGCDEALINRRGFPEGFIFGSASAAYQIEGAYNENGKGSTMWDYFTHTYPVQFLFFFFPFSFKCRNNYKTFEIAEKILDGTNGDVAVDSYHLYKDDVQIAKEMGLDSYRFSITWARILPGIEPFVTMFHLDTPQALEDAYGGFLSSQMVADFEEFADLLFREFGDRVKKWLTVNEPWCFSNLGYAAGIFAPGRCSEWVGRNCAGGDSATEPYIVTHNQLLAHATVVKLYRTKYQESQKGEIGMAVNTFWFLPYYNTDEHRKAADRALDFMFGWVMDPITFGRYPESMRTLAGSRLPNFTKEEADMVKGSYDFLGLNYYSGMYAKDNPINSSNNLSFTTDSGAKTTGIDEIRNDSLPLSKALRDVKRKEYFYDHLCCLREAIEKDGVNVKGYFAWALTDNFEWASGYLVRFGIYYIDFNDKLLRRFPKYSALWLKSIFGGRIDEKPAESIISDQ
ncbi:hypothetical protein RD792_008828 [Penstemon davidsonii]|uniref:Beta-glucosidase n=1 Tax=Penstemon davidsonii TaxID=160366 RepID=A0ABR0DB10_9LAMI|nr:hypothetical protein RD792_008828 [Penstemon davidsonii]